MTCRSLRESTGGRDFVGMIRTLSPEPCGVKEKVRKKPHCVKTRTVNAAAGMLGNHQARTLTVCFEDSVMWRTAPFCSAWRMSSGSKKAYGSIAFEAASL